MTAVAPAAGGGPTEDAEALLALNPPGRGAGAPRPPFTRLNGRDASA